ncbi:O-antigen polysaccharide polymerase Wzy [Fusobacterium mortiferum]|uniref:O-antigen polysaccharide polymerase Wzy n=1 Tax=Fusobacterium mortiferum TaxID=850 RepID=UPI00158D53CC|nr:O-antigen polysaccharide polymerase Wzy [Fusobacterium mortiferum]
MREKIEVILTIILTILLIILKACFEEKELVIIFITSLNIIYLAYRLRERKKNIMIFYFSICNFVFNTSISMTKIIKNEYILNSMFFTNRIPYTKEVSKFVYDILILNNLGILIGIILVYFFKSIKNRYKVRNDKKIILKYLVIILLVSFIFILKENVDNVLEVMKIGYVKSYLREQEKNLLYYFITIFEFLFVIYFGLKPKKSKKILLIVIISIFVAFVSSFAGSRAVLLMKLVFIIWYLEVQNYLKIKKRYAILLIFLVFIYSNKIRNLRNTYGKQNYSITRIEKETIIEIPLKFLESQNGTASLIGYIKVFPEIVEGEKYGKMILSSYYTFYNSFFRKELLEKFKSKEIGEKMNDFSRISYIVNYNHLKKGYGLGGNYIIEMYEVGREIGVLFLSSFFILLIFYLENLFKKDKSVYCNIFVLLVFQSIFMAPRSYYFDFNIREYLWLCLGYFVLLNFVKQIKSK